MNLVFRTVTRPFVDRPDEEERLASYLRNHLVYGPDAIPSEGKTVSFQACSTVKEMIEATEKGVDYPYLAGEARFFGDSLVSMLNRATDQAEANGGWGEKAEPTLHASDCATNSEPYAPAGPCNCEATTAPEDVPPFQIGDVVRLVSGGPNLAVTDCFRCSLCGEWHIDVCWHDYNGIYHELDGMEVELFAMVTDNGR